MTARIHKGDCLPANTSMFVGGSFAYLLEKLGFDHKTEVKDKRLVMGLVESQREPGLRYGHAWIECSAEGLELALDFSNDREIILPRDLFYLAGNIQEDGLRRYNQEQTFNLMFESEAYFYFPYSALPWIINPDGSEDWLDYEGRYEKIIEKFC